MTETWTITFGECVENHAGMVKHGTLSPRGFSREEILRAGHMAQASGFQVEFHDLAANLTPEQTALLSPEELQTACVLIVRKGAALFFHPEDYELFVKETQTTRERVDKKAIMRGRVVNKHARWNLCYADTPQTADIAAGKGTIVAFSEVPYLNQIRTLLPCILGEAAKGLFAELNYYYDIKNCGI